MANDWVALGHLSSTLSWASFLGSASVIAGILTERRNAEKAQGAVVAKRKRESAGGFIEQLLIFIAVSDACSGVGAGISLGTDAPRFPADHPALCGVQAFLAQFSHPASAAWQAVVAVELLRMLRSTSSSSADTWKRIRLYHAVIWPTALLLAIVPGAMGLFDNAGPWCWIGVDPDRVTTSWTMRWATFYVPIFVCSIIITTAHSMSARVVYVTLKRATSASSYAQTPAAAGRQTSTDSDRGGGQRQPAPTILRSQYMRKQLMRFALFPFFFLVTWSWAIAARVMDEVRGADEVPAWLFVVFTVFVRSIGMINASVFALTNVHVRHAIKAFLCKPCIARGFVEAPAAPRSGSRAKSSSRPASSHGSAASPASSSRAQHGRSASAGASESKHGAVDEEVASAGARTQRGSSYETLNPLPGAGAAPVAERE